MIVSHLAQEVGHATSQATPVNPTRHSVALPVYLEHIKVFVALQVSEQLGPHRPAAHTEHVPPATGVGAEHAADTAAATANCEVQLGPVKPGEHDRHVP